jgi:small subunit ribosomal protein S2
VAAEAVDVLQIPEGVNLVGDKAFADELPEPEADAEASEAAPFEAEDVDLEAALGGGIRKAPAAVHYLSSAQEPSC